MILLVLVDLSGLDERPEDALGSNCIAMWNCLCITITWFCRKPMPNNWATSELLFVGSPLVSRGSMIG
jgi:hypothetical protein